MPQLTALLGVLATAVRSKGARRCSAVCLICGASRGSCGQIATGRGQVLPGRGRGGGRGMLGDVSTSARELLPDITVARVFDSIDDWQQSHLRPFRVAHDGKAYSIEEVEEWYPTSWEKMWDDGHDIPVTNVAPHGLAAASVSRSMTERALTELLPCFASGVPAFNLGWEVANVRHTRQSKKNREENLEQWKVRPASGGQLSDFPALHALLEEVHRQFCKQGITQNRPLEPRICVICRQYLLGESLPFHCDRKDWYAEEVYNCVLENTSPDGLEYIKVGSSQSMLRYVPDEHVGLCNLFLGEARYGWFHGVPSLRHGKRYSVSWRWFNDDVEIEAEGCHL